MAHQDYSFQNVRAAAILTNSYVAGTVIGTQSSAQLQLLNQLVVYVSFTKGSLTSAELKVEFSNDNTTWYQESTAAISGGTATVSPLEYTFNATTQNYRIPVPVKDTYVRISVKGTGTLTSSSMTVDAIVGIA